MANKILSKKVKTEQEQTFLKGILFTLAIFCKFVSNTKIGVIQWPRGQQEVGR